MSASIFPQTPEFQASVDVITQFRLQLTEQKDAFWARKVVMSCGFKTAMQLIEGSVKDALFDLVAGSILEDLIHEYPSRDQMEMAHEMIDDCELLFAAVLADKL
jgi:hypothetical protein